MYGHDEVFDEVRRSPFTVKEAAEYLAVAEITVRRWIKAGKISQVWTCLIMSMWPVHL